MSKTGNKKRKADSRGFTLIEVMVAVAVLSFGLVMVYQAFFIVLDSFNYSADYLEIVSWMDEKIWQVQDSIMRTGALEGNSNQGEFVARNKNFDWAISSNVLGSAGNLYAVNLEVNWKEAKRKVKLSRFCYAKYEQKQP
ncbi:MAG: prepilin-type N-terminal cleavage/methylation domain-containing protein [Candidatus Omnitrophica bacterium]|nr:prepilin-type N-terminal cleavage/methylation domain-containing protein [Candidatus Omnitrophota bacterium]